MLPAAYPVDVPDRPLLRYLDGDAVERAMPPLVERLALAEATMVGLAGEAQLPPKLAVHPRVPESFAHAMPAFLPGLAADGSDDLLGIKWVVGFPPNRTRGLAAISAIVLLDDATTGLPIGILDGAPITAQRTAAVSGLAMARFAPPRTRPAHVAIVGAGVQGHAHVPVVAHLLPGASIAVHDRHADRADALAAVATATDGIERAIVAGSPRDAVVGADVVITAVSFGPVRQVMVADWLAPDALVVAVDYATMVAADVARDASLFIVDERGQFLANRAVGAFDGYPDPVHTLGEAIIAGTPRPPSGRVLVTHLGVGLADVIFGHAILRRATEAGLGLILPT
jgi:ornithine cyclodeaminase/alanine dehydrogenase